MGSCLFLPDRRCSVPFLIVSARLFLPWSSDRGCLFAKLIVINSDYFFDNSGKKLFFFKRAYIDTGDWLWPLSPALRYSSLSQSFKDWYQLGVGFWICIVAMALGGVLVSAVEMFSALLRHSRYTASQTNTSDISNQVRRILGDNCLLGYIFLPLSLILGDSSCMGKRQWRHTSAIMHGIV